MAIEDLLDEIREEIRDRMERQVDEVFLAGYDAGFAASGEGWNGEHPFRDPGPNHRQMGVYHDHRATALSAYLNEEVTS